MFNNSVLEKFSEFKRQDVSDLFTFYQENKFRLLKCNNQLKADKAPVLMIPAMINRYYILDISKTNSMLANLAEQGHPVYIIDWGEASPEDRWMSFSDVFLGTLKRFITKIRWEENQKPVLFGYCMGGSMSVIYSSIFPEDIRALIVLTAPIDFHKAGVMSLWTSREHLDTEKLVDALGNVPAEMTQSSFVSLKPAKWWRKWSSFWQKQDNEKFVDSFLEMENWVNDNIPFPGGIWKEYIQSLYQDNRLYRDTLYIGSHKASLKNIRIPVLTLVANDDHIVPPEAAEPLHQLISSENKEIVYFNGGHVGIISSPKLFPQLADSVNKWLETV